MKRSKTIKERVDLKTGAQAAPIQSLPQSVQLSCFTKVAKKEYFLEDLKKQQKNFEMIRPSVVVPTLLHGRKHVTDSPTLLTLLTFISFLDFKPFPKAFQAFSQAALQYKSVTNEPQVNIAQMVVKAVSLLLPHTDLKKASPLCGGTHFVLALIAKICMSGS